LSNIWGQGYEHTITFLAHIVIKLTPGAHTLRTSYGRNQFLLLVS
jgi:hypothetical protein